MKTTKLLIACLASTVLFTSCDELKGTLVTSAPIAVQKDGKPYTLRTGSNKVKVKVKNENTIQLKVQTTNGEKDIKVNTNFNAKQLRDGQVIDIPAGLTGQSFGVQGIFRDVTTRSSTINTTQSCSYTITDRQCHQVYVQPSCQTVTECNPRNPSQCSTRQVCTDGGYRQLCEDVQITRNGYQDVSYYDSYRQVSLHLDLIVAGQKPGQLDSSSSDSDRIYTFQGSCR